MLRKVDWTRETKGRWNHDCLLTWSMRTEMLRRSSERTREGLRTAAWRPTIPGETWGEVGVVGWWGEGGIRVGAPNLVVRAFSPNEHDFSCQ